MKRIGKIIKMTGAGFSYGQYYESMNHALKRLNNEYTMLHYPYYKNESDDFFQAQKNLTNHCISLFDTLEGKNVLEIGCGNGIQALYINENYSPLSITGIDLSEANIKIANLEKERTNANNVNFIVDDAQNLKSIPSNSIDILLNIESAFHYPDKYAFLKEVNRVLKPNGQYLIADILTRRKKKTGILNLWRNKMIYHFWNRSQYESELGNLKMENTHFEDITYHVIKGWSLYRNWLPQIKMNSIFQDVAFRLFYFINARMNVFFLKRMQQYCIYKGNKPDFQE